MRGGGSGEGGLGVNNCSGCKGGIEADAERNVVASSSITLDSSMRKSISSSMVDGPGAAVFTEEVRGWGMLVVAEVG